MKLLQWTFRQWVAGVGICTQIVFFAQWVSAADVSDLATAPHYPDIHHKSGDGKTYSKNRNKSFQLAENKSIGSWDTNITEDPGQDFSEMDAEITLTKGEFEDPFAPEVPELSDPYENHNRFIFNLNNKIYNHFTKHVAKGYRFTVPLDVRIVIRNIFNNASMPVKLVSSLIQGNMEKSGKVVGRFLINSTAGLGGMLDVADQEYNIKPVNENMSQALGYYDVPTGPYLVLPLLGPSSIRNLVGRTADIFVNPAFLFSAPFMVTSGVATGKKVNETSFLVKTKKELEQNSLDEYESTRDFYKQYHYRLVKE